MAPRGPGAARLLAGPEAWTLSEGRLFIRSFGNENSSSNGNVFELRCAMAWVQASFSNFKSFLKVILDSPGRLCAVSFAYNIEDYLSIFHNLFRIGTPVIHRKAPLPAFAMHEVM